MTTRAREFLDRSRGLLNRSRAAAAEFLSQPGQFDGRPGAWTLQPTGPPTDDDHRAEPGKDSADTADAALAGICSSLAMRDLNLVDSLLAQLEEMEASEEDHHRLGELYRLDHLATRLRRNAENLRVLSGRDSGEAGSHTSSLVDVIRAGMSSIENYARVAIGRTVSLGIVAFAADDISRLLAELLDNATTQSPPDSQVRISAHLTETGSVLIRIEDDGIGLPPQRLAELNERLHADPVLDDAAVRHMGLAVVRRIAARHELRTNLERRSPHGTTATVLLPAHVVCELDEDAWSGIHTVVMPRSGRTQVPEPAQPQPQAARIPSQQEAESSGAHAPAQAAAAPSPTPRSAPLRPQAEQPAAGTTTQSGLPRRVSRSIRNADAGPQDVMSTSDTAEGHAKLLADLDAFSDGEQQAHDGTDGESPNGQAQQPPEQPQEGNQQ